MSNSEPTWPEKATIPSEFCSTMGKATDKKHFNKAIDRCIQAFHDWQDGRKCVWGAKNGLIIASCGDFRMIDEDHPDRSEYKFCPYCGSRIEVKED